MMKKMEAEVRSLNSRNGGGTEDVGALGGEGEEGKRSSNRRRVVGIIGAGMTGVCVCKYMVQQGMEAVVMEAQPGMGGVWRHNFANTRLQTPRDAYQFSDFLWPHGTPLYPSHVHVLEYLESYARKFHVLPRILFNTKVVAIRQMHPGSSSSSPRWAVLIRRSSSMAQSDVKQVPHDAAAEHEERWLYFDYLVSCVGRYGDVPKLPILPKSHGFEIFRGKILHTMEYAMLDDRAACELVQSKRVVVVGMMKSALDAAAQIAIANKGTTNGQQSCTMVFRTPHWMLPHHKPFGLPLSYLYSTRLSELMIAKPDQGPFLDVVSTLLRPVRWAISKLVELYLLLNLPLCEYGLVPSQSFFEQFASCQVPLLPDNFFEDVKNGHIQLRRTSQWGFTERGVMLEDGTHIEADVVILGTGYDGEKKLRSLLEDVTSKDGFPPEPGNVVPLYRGIIPPEIPHLAIMGFYENFSNLHSSEMGARWLSHLVSGKISLPPLPSMVRAVQQWIQYMKSSTPFYQKSCVGAVSIWHSDQMCCDLGWNPKRKTNFLRDLLVPYSNMDYRD